MPTDTCFAWPSWLSGVARSLDLGGVFDDELDDMEPELADALALYDDWRMVGRDIVQAAETVSRQLTKESINVE